jgi:drug/metabolite transporter (DMT)-like permease
VADFSGGSLTKRLPTFAVTVVSQAAGFVALLLAIGVRGEVTGRSLALGAVAGLGGGAGLAAFYRALSIGTMSVVSPLAACGAVVPFAIALAAGDRPSVLALAGAVAALGGAVLASVEERRASSPERGRAVALAVFAAVALGVFVYFLGLGSREGDVLSTLVGARVGSLAALLVLAGAMRAPLRLAPASVPAVAAVGLADVSANALFAVASSRGLLSLVAVLGSLYPVVTVLLAHALLGERLTRAQQAGVVVALAGVAAIAGG